MKTVCCPGYNYNVIVATHALGHMYGYTLLVPKNQRVLKKLRKEHTLRFRIIGGAGIVGGLETLVYINNRGGGVETLALTLTFLHL